MVARDFDCEDGEYPAVVVAAALELRF